MFMKLKCRCISAISPSIPTAPARNGTNVSAVIFTVRKLRNMRMNTATKPMSVARRASAMTMRRSVLLTRFTPVRMSPGWRSATASSVGGTSRGQLLPVG